MAIEKKRKKAPLPIEEVAKGDFESLVDSIRENPIVYAVSVVFVLACVVAGLAYRSHAASKETETATQYVRALETEDAATQSAELEQVAGGKSKLAAEAAYMAAEAAYRANDSAKAKEGFERVRSQYPDSSYTPDAVEGLGFIAEDAKDYEGAVALYDEIMAKWGLSFTARRQWLNIGRCREALGQSKEAVEAYQQQVEWFPDSNVAKDAQAALDRIRETNPDLFPKEEAKEAPPAPTAEEAPAKPAAVGEVDLTPDANAPQASQPEPPSESDASESENAPAASVEETPTAPAEPAASEEPATESQSK